MNRVAARLVATKAWQAWEVIFCVGSLLLLLAMALLPGCASSGDAYQASSMAFVGAVDAATELRKAGKLDAEEVAVINSAVAEGDAALHSWAEKLKAGEDYSGEEIVKGVVERIRSYLVKRRK